MNENHRYEESVDCVYFHSKKTLDGVPHQQLLMKIKIVVLVDKYLNGLKLESVGESEK